MANGLFIPAFRGPGSPGAPGVGTTRAAILAQQEQEAQAGRRQQLGGLLGSVFQRPGLQAPAQPPGLQPQQPGAAPITELPQPGATQPRQITQPTQDEALAQIFAIDPTLGDKVFESIGAITSRQREDASRRAFEIRNTPFDQRAAVIQRQANELRRQGRNPRDTEELVNFSQQDQDQILRTIELAALTPQQRADIARGGRTAAQREFTELTKGLTEEQEQQARLIKLGLSPRAVGSAIQTISEKGIAEEIGDVEATIAERRKFGELTGSSRSKAIDAGFERITKIDKGINNIDRAIEAVRGGAGTGAIEKLFPSIRAASVELDNIQGELALDVIGGVTFGALSKGELDLAKQVALPTGLDRDDLIKFMESKKDAQLKLRGYFQEQIDFLDQGGTIAGFLRSRERSLTTQDSTTQEQGQIMVDAQGNRARVFPDGRIEEL